MSGHRLGGRFCEFVVRGGIPSCRGMPRLRLTGSHPVALLDGASPVRHGAPLSLGPAYCVLPGMSVRGTTVSFSAGAHFSACCRPARSGPDNSSAASGRPGRLPARAACPGASRVIDCGCSVGVPRPMVPRRRACAAGRGASSANRSQRHEGSPLGSERGKNMHFEGSRNTKPALCCSALVALSTRLFGQAAPAAGTRL